MTGEMQPARTDWSVAQLAGAAGLDTPVGERGGALSVGERQLVTLVRAAIADPDLLVLDEATSAVDPATEVRISRALTRLTSDRTVVTIAHRLSTAEAADRVLVFEAPMPNSSLRAACTDACTSHGSAARQFEHRGSNGGTHTRKPAFGPVPMLRIRLPQSAVSDKRPA